MELLAKKGLFETRHISEIGMIYKYTMPTQSFRFLIKLKRIWLQKH